MTPEYVKAALAKIESAKGDAEAAHAMQDELWERVLRAIADGTCTAPQVCADLALLSSKIEFARHDA